VARIPGSSEIMSNVTRAGSRIRRLGVGVITLLVAAPTAFILFAMALFVVEFVMYPLASLVIAVVTALIASFAAWRLAGDGMRTDVNNVAARSLAWGVIPAVAAFVSPWVYPRVDILLAAVLIYSVVTATTLTFRHRTAETSVRKGLIQSAGWLAGTGLAVAAVIFIASLLGLTGA